MKSLRNVIVVCTLFVLSAFAHEGSHGMKGTVKAITDTTLTIETMVKKTQTIHFDDKTVFTKSGAAATVKDLKVGDRVVIESHDMGGKMHAVNVRFGKAAKKTQAAKPAGEDHSKHANQEKK